MNIVKKTLSVIGIGMLSLVMVGKAAPAAAADGPSVDVGYQYMHHSDNGDSTSLPAGFMVGVDVPLQSPWSVVGEFGLNRKSEDGGHITPITFGAGLRFTPETMSQFMPYVQAVVGVEQDRFSGGGASDTESGFMLQPGVGGMFGLGSLKAFVEADYRWVHQSGGSANNFVARAGVVIPVGKK